MPQAEVGGRYWKDFYEMMTLEQELKGSEHLRMSLRGKRSLNKGRSSRLSDADQQVCSVSSREIARRPM